MKTKPKSRALKMTIFAQGCFLLVLFFLIPAADPSLPALAQGNEAMDAAKTLIELRANLLSRGNPQMLELYYDKEAIAGRWALEKEQARIRYMRQWLQERNIEIVNTQVEFTRSEAEANQNRAELSVCVHTLFTYRHIDFPDSSDTTMGWRTVHWLELTRRGSDWIVCSEWFVDPLQNASERPVVASGNPKLKTLLDQPAQLQFALWRQNAAAYADRFAGVQVDSKTGRYNQRYRDFAGLGGDCANFVSQALIDDEGGNLPRDWGWFYANGEGTVAWLKADALAYHLMASGRAMRLIRGTFTEVCSGTSDQVVSALQQLEPGDIIAYEPRGEITHVSLVVGRDLAGYILVSSHTADRYRVPWDLGYCSDTMFHLLKIRG